MKNKLIQNPSRVIELAIEKYKLSNWDEQFFPAFTNWDILGSKDNLIKLFGESGTFYCPTCELETPELGHGEECPVGYEVMVSCPKWSWEAKSLYEHVLSGGSIENELEKARV